MREVFRVATAQAGGVNQVSYAARVTDATQIVVRASTDFFYATCVYDLAAGPVAISIPKSATRTRSSRCSTTTWTIST